MGNKVEARFCLRKKRNYWASLADAPLQEPSITIFPDLDGNPDTKISKIFTKGCIAISLEGSGHVVPSKFMNFGILGGNAKKYLQPKDF